MNGLHKISNPCETLHEWLVLHQHMIECVDKVQTDFSPLSSQGRYLSAPFLQYLHDALECKVAVRCVFHDSVENRRMLGEIRMMYLDNQCLGQSFTDKTLQFIPVSDHIGMMSTERLLEQLDLIVDGTGVCH